MLQHVWCPFTNLVFVVDCIFGMFCIKKSCLLFRNKWSLFTTVDECRCCSQSSLKICIVSARWGKVQCCFAKLIFFIISLLFASFRFNICNHWHLIVDWYHSCHSNRLWYPSRLLREVRVWRIALLIQLYIQHFLVYMHDRSLLQIIMIYVTKLVHFCFAM